MAVVEISFSSNNIHELLWGLGGEKNYSCVGPARNDLLEFWQDGSLLTSLWYLTLVTTLPFKSLQDSFIFLIFLFATLTWISWQCVSSYRKRTANGPVATVCISPAAGGGLAQRFVFWSWHHSWDNKVEGSSGPIRKQGLTSAWPFQMQRTADEWELCSEWCCWGCRLTAARVTGSNGLMALGWLTLAMLKNIKSCAISVMLTTTG